MKKYSILGVISLLLILISGCKNEESEAGLYNTWEAKNFMSVESMYYEKNENIKILLTFDANGSYHLKLDRNSCGGTFTPGIDNQIEIKSPACTKICCDSQFSQKLVVTISEVTSFSIEGKALKLNVPAWGWIALELHE